MMKAVRFASVDVIGEYFAKVAQAAQEAYEALLAEQEELEHYQLYWGRNSRARWLMTNRGLSFLDAAKQAEAEERAWEEDAVRQLSEMRAAVARGEEIDWGYYSDLYKDLYGVRPH